MKKLIFIILALSFYPFGCEAQVKINGNSNNGRYQFEEELKKDIDSLMIIIESYKIQVEGLEKTVADNEALIIAKEAELNAAVLNADKLVADIVSLNSVIVVEKAISESLKGKIVSLEDQLVVKDAEIVDLKNQLAKKPIRDTIFITEIPEKKIDTFITISDPILLDFTDSLVQPKTPADVYVMVMGIGLVHLQEVDTIYRFQRHFEIERTVNYADTLHTSTYKNLRLPFQFRNVEIIETTSSEIMVRSWMTEQSKIKYHLNGAAQEHPASSENFDASKLSDIEYRHTRTLGGLEPGTIYKIQIWIESENGHVDLWNISATTKD